MGKEAIKVPFKYLGRNQTLVKNENIILSSKLVKRDSTSADFDHSNRAYEKLEKRIDIIRLKYLQLIHDIHLNRHTKYRGLRLVCPKPQIKCHADCS